MGQFNLQKMFQELREQGRPVDLRELAEHWEPTPDEEEEQS